MTWLLSGGIGLFLELGEGGAAAVLPLSQVQHLPAIQVLPDALRQNDHQVIYVVVFIGWDTCEEKHREGAGAWPTSPQLSDLSQAQTAHLHGNTRRCGW